MARRKMTKKQKKEFSKIMCVIAFVIFLAIGLWMIFEYYHLMKLAIEAGTGVMPDSALPIAGITFILSPLISYLVYQFGLKNSRNKYGVDENGEPYQRLIE